MKVKGSLVFFIGNSEVKGGIAAYDDKKKPRVITTRIRTIPFNAERSREQFEKRILNEFAQLVSEMKTKDVPIAMAKGVHIEEALVVLASPWYVSETSMVKMREQKEFLVTDRLLDSSKENIVKAYRDAHEVDIALLEQRILQISLNGYKTADPLKKKAMELDMSVFTSFSRKSSLDEIRRVIDQSFHIPNIKIHSHSLVAFTVLASISTNIDRYILADITSRLTELVVVKHGYLAESASFPKGKNYIIEVISKSMGVSEEVASTFLRNKDNNILEPALEEKISSALEEARVTWLKEFTAALSVLSSGSSLPKHFYLFASKDSGHIFSNFILSESYQQFSFAEGTFEVRVVTAADFKDLYTYESGVVADPSIVVGTLFRNF